MYVDKKLTVLALAALVLLLGALRPGLPPERSEASFPVGGIAALPSALPAVIPVAAVGSPGTPQTLPAIAPASGPGSFALVSAICEGDCPRHRAGPGVPGAVAPIEFTMTKLYPPGVPVGATFTANGEQTLLCTDDTTCDLTVEMGGIVNHVAVGLTGGGVNEAITVTACDILGDCRGVMVFFVETIFVFPAGFLLGDPGGTPTFASYRCDDVGRYTGVSGLQGGTLAARYLPALGFMSPEVTFEEVFDWFYGTAHLAGANLTRLRDRGDVPPLHDIPFYSCGGDTPDNPVDDRVNFETDLGILSVEAMGDGAADVMVVGPVSFRPMGTLTPGCDVGDSVDVPDHPGPTVDTASGVPTLLDIPATWCDLDFAPNGVVTYTLWPTGDTGTATVTGQQSGGGGVLRTGYPPFAGGAALGLMMEAPEVIGLEGGQFSLVLIDADFRFLGGQTMACMAEPLDAVIAIVPQTATSAAFPEPFVNFTLYPTRVAVETGVDVTITCYLDSNPDVKVVTSVRIGKPAETVELVVVEEGCSPVSSTWPDGTDIEDVVAAVTPAKALKAIWQLADPATGTWLGWSADVPAEENDLTSVNFLDSLFFCVGEAATLSRPSLGPPVHLTLRWTPDVPLEVDLKDVYTNVLSFENLGPTPADDMVLSLDLPSGVSWQDNVEVEIVDDADGSITDVDCSSQPAVGDLDGTLTCTVRGTMTPPSRLGGGPDPGDSVEIRYDVRCEMPGRHDTTMSASVADIEGIPRGFSTSEFTTVCLLPGS